MVDEGETNSGPAWKRRQIVEWAESYEILYGGTVIGRVYQSSERWKCSDYLKRSVPIGRSVDFEDAADLLFGIWLESPGASESAWT